MAQSRSGKDLASDRVGAGEWRRPRTSPGNRTLVCQVAVVQHGTEVPGSVETGQSESPNGGWLRVAQARTWRVVGSVQANVGGLAPTLEVGPGLPGGSGPERG